MDEKITSKQVNPPNPTGKGGFKDNPQNINPGGRPKNQESFSYWLNQFKNMSLNEFKDWANKNDNPSIAAKAAYNRMVKAVDELREFEVVANRTEGMPKASLELGADETVDEIEFKITRNNENNPRRD